ncbi:FTR1 family iron permease [Gemella sp. oral taxon 928]|uniref:FTR1 family iron permease n=1 Tax=Gemella sp. oral taxon 928 TaxID=1785995 RepID=UPI000ADD8A51|nr:FTR1 family protein [Gemella sp. oral taxon 928]
MSILVKNYLSKIIIAVAIVLSAILPYSYYAQAKDRTSYSQLFIKITDATTALKNNDNDKAKKLIEEFKTEFESTKNSDSEAGKKVKQTIKTDNINEEQLRELSTALLNFENEQNPLDVDAEKKAFKTKLFPAFNKLEKAIDTKDVETMKAEYVKYNAAWVRNEGILRTLEPAYYGKIETTMSFLRSSMEVEPYDYQTTKMYLTDLKKYLDDFLVGKKLEQNNDVKTLEQGIKLLEESYNSFVNGDKAQGSQKMKKFIEVWPVIEGDVRTRNASLYTKVESETPIIMVKGDEVKYQEQLKNLITELSKIDTKSNYNAIDSMLILLREGVEALVIVLSLAGALRAAKQRKGLIWVYAGAIVGILASILAAVILKYSFPVLASGTNREIIEGVVGIFAVVMMIGIGIWLHGKSSVKAWKNYMDKKLNLMLSTGSFISMFTLSFLAVFREGAETILFYAEIMPLISTASLLTGIGLAVIALIIIGFVMLKASDKLPISKVFLVLSWLIYILGFKMLGVSVHALQITNMVSNHILEHIPTIEWLGIYPSTEVLGSQIIYIIIVVASILYEKSKHK